MTRRGFASYDPFVVHKTTSCLHFGVHVAMQGLTSGNLLGSSPLFQRGGRPSAVPPATNCVPAFFISAPPPPPSSPCQENYPPDEQPSAHKSVLESANTAWTWSVHLDAPGHRLGQQPASATAEPGVVKQDKSSGGSVDTTKTRSDPQRVRMSSGERPIGAAKGKQRNTEALCQSPPPPKRATDSDCS